MVTGRSQTSIQRGLNKVRKARTVVMLLLVLVAISIIFIDKKEDKSSDNVRKGMEVALEKLTPVVAQDSFYDTTLHHEVAPKPNLVKASEEMPVPQVVSPIKDISVPDRAKESVPQPTEEKTKLTPQKEDENHSFAPLGNKRGKTLKKGQPKETSAPNPGDSEVEPGFHLVAPNESFSTIALKYYGDSSLWIALQRANQDIVRNPKALRAGKKIKIPSPDSIHQWLGGNPKRVFPKSRSTHGATFVATPSGDAVLTSPKSGSGRYYLVARGETLSGIAKRTGVSFLSLYEHNQELLKQNPNFLKEGTKIWIPVLR